MERITDKKELFKWKKSNVGAFLVNGTLCLLFSGFLLAGAWGLWSLIAVPVVNIIDSQDWVKTPAVIKSAEVAVHRHADSCNTYSPRITYAYEYRGNSFQSDRYNFNSGSSFRNKTSLILKEHPAGLNTHCYVNPLSPAEAVLNREAFSELMWGFLPLTFFLIGCILPYAGIYYYLNKEKWNLANFSDQIDEKTQKHLPSLTLHQQSDSRFRLKEFAPRWMFFAGWLFFTLFWYGITFFFCLLGYDDYLSTGKPDWLLFGFMAVFLTFGLLFIAGCVKNFLALFAPTPIVIANNALIPLGEELEVQWSFNKRIGSLQNFKLTLKGSEQSNKHHDDLGDEKSHLFYDEVIFSSDDPIEMESGTRAIAIPEGLFHSLALQHHKIEWSILAEGSVHFYPDFEHNYSFVVLPKKAI